MGVQHTCCLSSLGWEWDAVRGVHAWNARSIFQARLSFEARQELSSKNNNSQYSIFSLFLLTARFKKYYDNFSLLYILFYTIFKQLSDNSLQKLKLIERFLQIARQTPLSKMVKISYFRGHTPASARGLLCLNYAFL